MAKTSTKKPVARRTPAAKVAATKGTAPKAIVVKASAAEAAPNRVEWPVGAAAKAAKKPEKVIENIVAPPKTVPVTEPVVAAVAQTPVKVPVSAMPARPSVEPKPIPPRATPQGATKGTLIMTDAIETAKTYAEEAKARIQTAVADMNEKAKVAMEKSTKAMEELGEITKGNYEAIVESSKIAAKGVETLSQEAVEYSRKSFEKSTATFKSFAAVKSPAEFFQLQSELMSAAMDSFASEASKSSEAMLKLAGEISQPISNRVAIVSEKVKALAA